MAERRGGRHRVRLRPSGGKAAARKTAEGSAVGSEGQNLIRFGQTVVIVENDGGFHPNYPPNYTSNDD